MKQIFKNIGIVILGIIIGMIVNMGLIIIGGIFFPLTENFEPMNAINWDFKYFNLNEGFYALLYDGGTSCY